WAAEQLIPLRFFAWATYLTSRGPARHPPLHPSPNRNLKPGPCLHCDLVMRRSRYRHGAQQESRGNSWNIVRYAELAVEQVLSYASIGDRTARYPYCRG